jgi:DnaJ-class molecular chaperone
MATISMRVKIRCPDCDGPGSASCERCRGRGTVDELYSAWLAIRPGIADGTVVAPTGVLRGMVRPVSFRIRIRDRVAK